MPKCHDYENSCYCIPTSKELITFQFQSKFTQHSDSEDSDDDEKDGDKVEDEDEV